MSMMYVRNLVDLHLKYYTDYHDVDEDVRTISGCGGQWVFTIRTGVTSRYMDDSSSTISNTVASRLIYLS